MHIKVIVRLFIHSRVFFCTVYWHCLLLVMAGPNFSSVHCWLLLTFLNKLNIIIVVVILFDWNDMSAESFFCIIDGYHLHRWFFSTTHRYNLFPILIKRQTASAAIERVTNRKLL